MESECDIGFVWQLQNSSVHRVMTSTLGLVRHLTRGNKDVQHRLFPQLDRFLTLKGVDSELALALIEVWSSAVVPMKK